METDKEKLINGNFFIKHHRYSKPKIRHVWCSPDMKQIFWDEVQYVGVKGRKPAGFINASDVIQIVNGQIQSRKISKEESRERGNNIFTL